MKKNSPKQPKKNTHLSCEGRREEHRENGCEERRENGCEELREEFREEFWTVSCERESIFFLTKFFTQFFTTILNLLFNLLFNPLFYLFC